MKKASLCLLLGVQFSFAQDIVFEKPALTNAYYCKEATTDFIDNGPKFNLNYLSKSTALSWLFSEYLKKTTHKRVYEALATCINPLDAFGSKNTSVFIYTNNSTTQLIKKFKYKDTYYLSYFDLNNNTFT
ncbi:MAG: hypothetical protein HRT67_09745 [Flavobacteriaceae bacterium]|nr:hypothetical protein [Flavobacteriaceae bacterium]